jgi:DNA-binding LacI/PurR family transcriptional regulator
MVTIPGRRKRATIHDVAAAAGVSRGTVSRVVNNEPYVSAEARAAIEAAIEKVGYVPNTAARNLVMQRSQAVGLIVHEPHSLFLEDPNIGEILLGANTALSRADYQMVSLVIESDRDTERVARYLSGGFVDGVVIVSAREQDPITRVIERLALPAAFVGHPQDLHDLPFVGCRIGMIAAALDRDSGSDRLAGFTDALGDRFDADLVAPVPLYTYADGRDGMRALLARDPLIDGVFAASDVIAAGALNALREAGRRVPEDVGIVGFDDSAWALRCQPLLSTVRQPANGLGQRAAESVLSQLRGEPAELGGILLDTEIVWRDSA